MTEGRYRLIRDETVGVVFGVDVEMNEKQIINAISDYIGQMKEKYSPHQHTIRCRLIAELGSFSLEKREGDPKPPSGD